MSLLEPCLLCVGASLLSTIGTIRWAAADPFGGACTGTIDVPDYVRRNMQLDGPHDGGVVAALGSARQAAFWLGRPTERARQIAPAFDIEAGRRLRDADLPESFEEALPRLLELL